ncbi:MAG: sugar phosphate nucleotidyltransferase [Firmicutes bacterium]|nr:sugar phosphate nucleotidyltransferase [Bacillota bacterium]MDY2920526.1 sugar phosphate nucleotidyltransferase [Lentihominibacter sp.]
MGKEPTLVVMAAGMGSRYGGLKQVDKITEAGEIILDFSLYDAMMAGFDRVIFVIREEHRDIFREMVDERAGRFMKVEYAYQKLDDIPEGFSIPEGREKPWGTSHAILACRDLIDGPFAVINADDYYGAGAFSTIYDYLNTHKDGDIYSYCMVAYKLKNTITENGHVTRGVCELDEKGFLSGITEKMEIMRREEGIACHEDDGSWMPLEDDTPVSMNFWGFTESFIDELKKGAYDFFENKVPENPLKSEFLLPVSVDKLIKSGKAQVEVLRSSDKWCGVTYKEDREQVRDQLQARKDKGEYPEKLWK